MHRSTLGRLLPLLAMASAACSSSSTTPTPITPSGATYTLTAQAGDAQSGTVGTALATAPTVLVKNSSGAAAAGVVVTFGVDSGGGSIAGSTVTTGSDGIAKAGAWTLGATAGSNVLHASATGATTIVFRATALAVVAPPPGNLTYSAWKLTATSVGLGTGDALPAADTTDLVLTQSLRNYATLTSFWNTPRTGAFNPTFWYIASTSNIGGTSYAPNLLISDSLPGTAAGGANPFLYTFATPVAGYPTGIDDTTLSPKWTLTGTPPTAGTITAQYPFIDRNLQFSVPGFQQSIFTCIATFTSVVVSYQVTFTMNNTTGSGTITYLFRDLTPSCSQPNTTKKSWHLVVQFTAARVK